MSEHTERDELAGLLFTTDNSRSVNPWSEWEHCKNEPRLVEYVYAMADAILAAGYRKTEPAWADTLTNDGTYEYTVSSDCDGSNVQYWRRIPGKSYTEAASPWQAYEPEASL